MCHDDTHHSVFSKCEDCDLTFKANNLLANILEILNHKASNCSNKKECLPKIYYDCKQCSFTSKNLYEFKNHMRDSHEILSASTSPAPKKTRHNSNEEGDLMWWDDVGSSLVDSLEKIELDDARGKRKKKIRRYRICQ